MALLAIAATLAWAWMAPAYTEERPLRRTARYVYERRDTPADTAFWEVAELEPGLDIGTAHRRVDGGRVRCAASVLASAARRTRSSFAARGSRSSRANRHPLT